MRKSCAVTGLAAQKYYSYSFYYTQVPTPSLVGIGIIDRCELYHLFKMFMQVHTQLFLLSKQYMVNFG